MNILEKYRASAKSAATQVGKAASISKSSYQKVLAASKNLGKLISSVPGNQPLSLPQPDLKNPRKFNSKYDLPQQPPKYTDTIK